MSPFDQLMDAVDHPALDPHKSQGLVLTAAQISTWIKAGASMEFDIIPAVRAVMSRKTGHDRISSWRYFDAAVRDRLGKRLGAAVAADFAKALKMTLGAPSSAETRENTQRRVSRESRF